MIFERDRLMEQMSCDNLICAANRLHISIHFCVFTYVPEPRLSNAKPVKRQIRQSGNTSAPIPL